MPITAGEVSSFCDMACSLSLVPLAKLRLLVGQEHGRTIPLADIERLKLGRARATAAGLANSALFQRRHYG
jgi:hypothetical protein